MSAYYNEIDPHAAEWLRNLIAEGVIAHGEVDQRSILDVRPSDLAGFTQCHFFAGIGVWSYALRLAGVSDATPVWTGSCPCQPFSAAGKSGGFADERHLWPAWHWLIEQCRPERIYGEQVASPDGLAWLDLVHADLEGAGYAVRSGDLCAAGVGAPHIRQRLFIVADAQSAGRADGASIGRGGQSFYGAGCAVVGTGDTCLDGGLADANESKWRRWSPDGRSECDRPHAGRSQDQRDPAGSGEAIELADAAGGRQREFGRAEVEGRSGHADGGQSSGVALGDAKREGLERLGGHGDDGREPGRVGALAHGSTRQASAIERPGPVNGFWRDADWIACTDGKWRPVEPGTFPLVDGSAFRLGPGGAVVVDAGSNRGSTWQGKSRAQMLKGYGNAIVAPLAAQFIRDTMLTKE